MAGQSKILNIGSVEQMLVVRERDAAIVTEVPARSVEEMVASSPAA